MYTIDYNLLKNVCLAPIDDFKSLQGVTVTDTQNGILIYRDNPKAKILAVAHLDSVLGDRHFYRNKINGDSIVLNAQLDDRLGAYVLLDILPQLGIEYDLLLTEGEEQGMSTAMYFESAKPYNWMFSFDRAGDDVVMYQYDCSEIRHDLKQAGLKPAYGSFSDIAFLDHLNVRGINVGTGYYGEHGHLCHASMKVLRSQIKRFKDFYTLFEDKSYPYTWTSPAKPTVLKPLPYNALPYSDDFYNDRFLKSQSRVEKSFNPECYLCLDKVGTHQIVNDIWLCDSCFGQCEYCTVCQDIYYADEVTDGVCVNCR